MVQKKRARRGDFSPVLDLTSKYAEEVCKGKVIAGPVVRAAAKRHLKDLDRKFEFYWDLDRAKLALDFFPEILKLSSGEYEGREFTLFSWQQFIVGSLFGWVDKDGYRRFQKAYIETGKGSGKTPLAAGIGVRSICADGEARAECYVVARTAEQALVTFRDAAAMVHASEDLSDRLRVSGGITNPFNIAHIPSMSFMRRVSTDRLGKGKSGPKSSCVIADEFHEHDTSATVDFYDAGKKNRKQPLTIYITNSGAGMASPCGLLHSYAEKVCNGDVENDRFFAYICMQDEKEDPFDDKSCWVKTNPSLPSLPGFDYLKSQVREAKGMPSKRAIVERLNFCVWTDAEAPWLERPTWLGCEVKKLSDEREEAPAFIALDLSQKTDLTAGAIVWDLGDRIEAELSVWVPEENLEARAERDNAPYGLWAKKGFITPTPGSIVDFEFVAKWVADQLICWNVMGLAYDPWRILDLLRDLNRWEIDASDKECDAGLFIVPHPQGFVAGAKGVHKNTGKRKSLWMPKSIDETEEVIYNKQLNVLYNPCLRMAALGITAISDASSNRRFNKLTAITRIDPMIALTMAIGFAKSDILIGADSFAAAQAALQAGGA